MFVVMETSATEEELAYVENSIRELGYKPHTIHGDTRRVIGVTGNRGTEHRIFLEGLPGVQQVIPITKPYKLASREIKPENSVINIGGVRLGDGGVVMIAGPCAVEDREQTIRIAKKVADLGAHMLRGGAYKPRTSPYSFQGLGEPGLEILAEAHEITGLPIVTEVSDPALAELVAQYADMLQIGTRNMQNFELLKEVGRQGKPVLLKRGMSATLDETLMSVEYIMSNGSHDVVVCERGVRTFTSHARSTLDVSIVPAFKQVSHLPIIVDPSHACGQRYCVMPMALAGVAAGADGLIVEVHDDPPHALVDGLQALLPDDFRELMDSLKKITTALDRPLAIRSNKAEDRI